jgi:hypothetical protein
MKMKNLLGKPVLALLSVGLFLAFTVSLMAQVETVTTSTAGEATHEVNVENAEVVYLAGNDMVVKMENGQIQHFPNVPETDKIFVEGQELGIHDLKVGMKLQRTITTTTTPMIITKVETIRGKVFHVTPPTSVVITMANNKNHVFKIPNGTKFNIEGQDTNAWGLKKGMDIHVTTVTESPEMHVAVNQMTTGEFPQPPEETAMLIEEPTPAPAVAAAEPAPAPAPEPAAEEEATESLPATGSYLPAAGILGVLLLSLGLGLRGIRATR